MLANESMSRGLPAFVFHGTYKWYFSGDTIANLPSFFVSELLFNCSLIQCSVGMFFVSRTRGGSGTVASFHKHQVRHGPPDPSMKSGDFTEQILLTDAEFCLSSQGRCCGGGMGSYVTGVGS